MRLVQIAHFLLGVVSLVMAESPEDTSDKDSLIPRPTPLVSAHARVPWTLQSQRSKAQVKRLSGRLGSKRQTSSDCQYPDAATGSAQHCNNGGVCCSSPTFNGCCDAGTYCVGTEACCDIGTTSCGPDYCCRSGATCCGNLICCESGTVCQGDICVSPQISQQSVQSLQSIASTQSVYGVSLASVASVASVSIASASHNASSHKSAVIGGAVGGVVGGIALIAGIAFLWIFLKKKNSANAGQQMATNNQPSLLFQGGGENSPYTPNSFKQPGSPQSHMTTGAYTGAAEAMSGQSAYFPPSITTPLPMTMERARTTADDRVGSMSTLPYVVPPSVTAHLGVPSHPGGTA